MLQIHSFLAELAVERPLFHSEADFQHAFAWQLHQNFPTARIRLEYPFIVDKQIYIDIWSEIDDLRFAIELKYKTAKLESSDSDELYHLKHQSAQNLGRYDFLKDVQRLEQITHRSENTVGYAIMLTNDAGYWKPGRWTTNDAAFRLHESREIHGVLEWSNQAARGTTKEQSDSLTFEYRYVINWQPYSNIEEEQRGEFRYTVLQIPGRLN